MATDWLFYWTTLPFGLIFFGIAVTLPWWLWRWLLGPEYDRIGVMPYAAGYLAALAGLLVVSFGYAYHDFTGLPADGVFAQTRWWTFVPGRGIYMMVLSLLFVLPLLALVGVPVAAVLIRRHWFNFRTVLAVVAIVSSAMTYLVWSTPPNNWSKTHPLEWFTSVLTGLLPGVLMVALPFLLAIQYAVRLRCAGNSGAG